MASYEVDPELNKIIKELAGRRGATAEETAVWLITKGVQKYNAEHKWIKKAAKEGKATKPAPKAKAAKAAKAAPAPAKKRGPGRPKKTEVAATA